MCCLCAAVALAACGDGGTQLGSPPAMLVAISLPVDTIVTGERTDPPVSVRVEDALGGPVEGTPVRFVLLTGEGTLSPGVAVSGRDGVAESQFRASGSPGTATVRADVPSAPNVEALEFTVIAEAADSVSVSIIEGDAQKAEIGSQLPIPFVVEARTNAGDGAGGVSIVFRITEGKDHSAVLTADSVLTGADGVGRTVLTLGRVAGDYVVEALASRGVLSDTVRFHATATATFEGSVAFDSVSAGTLVTGQEATLFGGGFSPIPSENDVRIEGAAAQVLAASGTELSIVVPDFAGECLPVRDVGVRVLVQGDASNGQMIQLAPAEPFLELAPGEVATLRGPDAIGCMQFAPTATRREYRIAVGSTDRRANKSMAIRLTTRVPSDLSGSGIATSLTPRILDGAVTEGARLRARPDALLRENAFSELGRARARVSRRGPHANVSAAVVPQPGDTLQYRFAVGSDLSASCDATGTVIDGIVRGVGEHLILVEDTDVPAGGLGPEDWAALLPQLDQVIVPVDTAYFGGYDDIDGNGRVVVLFTPRLNALSAPGAGGIGGFFLPLDLSASGAGGGGLKGPGGEICPASNEAELIYLAAADPQGLAGPAIPVDRALRNARGLVAHELQHLINAERRVLQGDAGFDGREEVWLDEGLSTLAEEVTGLAFIARSVGGNYTFAEVANTRSELDAFNAFQINNFFNLSLYLFNSAQAPVISKVDFGGAGGLQMRGFAWFLLRWLGDHSPGDERVLFKTLDSGGPDAHRGIDNLERATVRSWDEILADFAVAVATDDAGIDGIDDRFQVLTWETRDVFAALHGNAAASAIFPASFPLRPTRLDVETGALDFDVGASTVRFFTLAPGLNAPALALAALTPGGARLSENSEPQITIVRTR